MPVSPVYPSVLLLRVIAKRKKLAAISMFSHIDTGYPSKTCPGVRRPQRKPFKPLLVIKKKTVYTPEKFR